MYMSGLLICGFFNGLPTEGRNVFSTMSYALCFSVYVGITPGEGFLVLDGNCPIGIFKKDHTSLGHH